jgi:predicted DNA-binding transcriptional regulator AlpA
VAVTAAKLRLYPVSPTATGRQPEMEIAMDTSMDLLTTDEVARITRAPVSTVRYWRHLGTGPRSFRLGRRVVYRRHEVEQWLREREMTDASAPAS